MTLVEWATVIGTVGTLIFGAWSLWKGKVKSSATASRLFLVLLVLYGGQFASAKWLGKTLLSDSSFSTFVMMLVIWIFWSSRDE
jgi:hypothetical protein